MNKDKFKKLIYEKINNILGNTEPLLNGKFPTNKQITHSCQ